MNDIENYTIQLTRVLENSEALISNIKPSSWAEQNIIMPGKPFPGPWRYDRTPYTREIVDCMAPDHPARWVAVMKGAQVGFSSGVIIPAVGWLIKNAPGNTAISVGSPELIEKAMEKLDLMIDSAGLRSYIKPTVQRNRAQKSGDTNFKKEFANGYVTIFNAGNHKAIRQIDLMYGFFDDFEAIKTESKESGSTRKLLEQRFAAYSDTHKIYYISTPESEGNSNIKAAYELGDKRKYLVPCPCCGTAIEWLWTIDVDGGTAGITWKQDDKGNLIKSSVGYICQVCAGFFNDKRKMEFLNSGIWNPSALPSREGFYSYHLSSLYAPLGMYDWEHYIYDYIGANKVGQPRDEALYKTFVNVCLGLPYDGEMEKPTANSIQRNIRQYEIGTIPDLQSVADGNGKIVLLTCSADMNGKVEDARLDYEVAAWSESGSKYSVLHGSIGTFIPRENTLKTKVDREHWTYEENKHNSVWPEFEKVLSSEFVSQSGRKMMIFKAGLDTGHFTTHAYAFLNKTNCPVIGLKGDKEDALTKVGITVPLFKKSLERPDLFILQVNLIKDRLSAHMQLNWSEGEEQPSNFMNFPQPSGGLYGFKNFFEHYESEQRKMVKSKSGAASRWEKKTSSAQNHFWDCAVYNLIMKDIVIRIIGQEVKNPALTWAEYATAIASSL